MKRYRKILRKVAWGIVGLLVLLLILHTPPMKSLFKGLIVRTAERQLNGQIEIGHLSYRLWRGEVKIEDVQLNLTGLHIRVTQLEAFLFSKQGISLNIDHPHLLFSPKEAKTERKEGTGGSSQPWSFLNKLGTVRIENGRFEWKEGQQNLLARGSLELKREDHDNLNRDGVWKLEGDLDCTFSGGPQIPIEIEAILALDGDSLLLNPEYLYPRLTQRAIPGRGCSIEHRSSHRAGLPTLHAGRNRTMVHVWKSQAR